MDQRLRQFVFRTARPLLSPFYTGVASILLFHNVVDDPPRERAAWVPGCEISSEALACLVHRLRARGHTFVSLDELCAALQHRPAGHGKLIAVTFDDGYASVHDKALPVLGALGVPFTLYLITAALDGLFVPWWYLLERQVVRELPPAERTPAFLRRAVAFEEAAPDELPALIERSFEARDIAHARGTTWLTWTQALALAQHPLVTIGAHTVRHPRLMSLSSREVRRELCASRRVIEQRLRCSVRHFSYPYGSQYHAGGREFALVRQCGFKTGVTTRLANLFPEHARHLEALPRIFGATPADIELAITGTVSAFLYRGRLVVSA